MLAGELKTGCGIVRLVDGLWRDKRPENPINAVQVLVSRARAQLGSDVIVNTSTGYRLALSESEVDASAVVLSASGAARHLRNGDEAAALSDAVAGLAFWDEPPLAGAADDPLSVLRAERALTYQSLVRVRALSLARLGRHAEALSPLTQLVADHPRDEELLLELLRCEDAVIGPSAAVVRYEDYRRSLRDELGTEPGHALRKMHQRLLQGQAPAVRHGVLHDPNPLLGRDDDVAAVSKLLSASRVTSIVGTGGLGKTRLAHVVSRHAEQRVVYFVPLAGITEGVAAEVQSTLDTPDVVQTLDSSRALLVLDNCEHVLDEVADLVHMVVTQTEDVRVLTTSRAPLGLSSEAVYPLPELDLPTAVELFTQRARAARSDVTLPAAVVEQLCHKLDGLPLALELAAARVRVMSVEEIARRLADRFSLLRGGTRDLPDRHHTLEAVVEWSWQLLDPAAQAALPVLSVFPGGFTAAAARHVLGSDDVIEQLVAHSLLKVRETKAGTRFVMLETVREFGALHRDPAVTTSFLAWAKDFGSAHFESPFHADPVAAAEIIRAEQDNLVHAMRLGVIRGDAPTVAATTAVLAGLWTVEASYQRVTALTDETAGLLSHYQPEPEFVDVLLAASGLCVLGSFATKGARAGRSLYTLRRLPVGDPGDNLVRAWAKVLAATPEFWGTEHSALEKLCTDPHPFIAGFANLLFSYGSVSDPARVLTSANRAIESFSAVDHPWLYVTALSLAASTHFHSGHLTQAKAYMAETLPVYEEMGSTWHVAQIRWAMVAISLGLDEIDEAEHWLALTALNGVDDFAGELLPGPGLRAEIALARGDIDTGLRRWRHVIDQLGSRRGEGFLAATPGLELWVLESRAVAVVAHAQHGRLGLVADLAAGLPDTLAQLLIERSTSSSPAVRTIQVIGALLVALAAVNPERAPRMIALAERCRYLRGFQPTMAPHRVRELAESVDKAAYLDAVAEYTALADDELRPAVAALLSPTPQPGRESLPPPRPRRRS
ncbi:LuxR family transcriptional regulator [Kibdelosporangium aridum]|uniref:LuxR family transcriptional regulator n=2 Tax=Kibdelosporangium aridum TaxID=2030 RepID=A0A428ZFF5_KIBAR|nr:LuxR family transcriptional regulator [Kibdelosporangium aridum]